MYLTPMMLLTFYGKFLLLVVCICTKAGTVTTARSLTATLGGSVDFTCTYTLAFYDRVYPGTISWQVKSGSGPEDFSNIATFSPPGQGSGSFTVFATDYKNRSELFNVTANGANYVVFMRVNEVVCSDEKRYRCLVGFVTDGVGQNTKHTKTSLTVKAPAEQPYEFPVPVPDNIEENMEVTFSCTANVGKPPGQIKWWRYRKGITAPQEMSGVSTNTPQVQEGVCVYNVTSTVTYRMTKDDDQSVWRCFVDNELLARPDRDKPYQESKRINVFFKVNVPTIRKVPDTGVNSQYSVGSSVNLICEADGNPSPGINSDTAVNRYLWTFRASPNDNATELTSSNGTLTLTNLQENDTGTYTCTAFNGFNGKFFNESQYLDLQIVKTTTTTTPTTTPLASSTGSSGRPTPAPQGGDGSIAGIVTTAGSLTATLGGSVDFTCTYTLGPDDTVYPGTISWQVKTGSGPDDFSNIATFSPPGQGPNSFTHFATNYKNGSELFNVSAIGANSYVVKLRVNKVMCSDEKRYRCWVGFVTIGIGFNHKHDDTSLTIKAPAEQPYEIPVPVPNNIEENMEVTFSCTANVGKPPGQIKWWRYRKGIIAPQEMSRVSTNIPQVQEGVCVYNVTSTVTYRMTKDDDQSVWRCFVDNELLTMPDRDKPNQESKRVNVLFKVNVPIIRKVPDMGDNSQYSVGSSVNLICEAEGNPSPGINSDIAINRYLWTFRASPNDNATELSSSNGTLTLTNLQESHTGTYTCTAFNGFNGKFFNASKNLNLQIVKI